MGHPSARLGAYHLGYSIGLRHGVAFIGLYIVATCGPLLASGRRVLVWFGLANLAAVVVLALLCASGFTSLWCFYAALVSGAIALHLRRRVHAPGADVMRRDGVARRRATARGPRKGVGRLSKVLLVRGSGGAFLRTFAARAGTLGRTRALAVALVVSGVGLILLLSWFVNHGESFMFTMHYNYYFGDLVGRVVNLQTLRQTGNIYVPFGAEAFTYPPGAILFFWPIQWVPAQHLTLVWTIGSLVALAGAYYVALDFLTKSPRGLIAGVSLWGAVITAIVFPEVTECLTWGQTATVLMLLVLLDELVVRGPAKGVMVGVATAVKIYPGLFIIAWLLRRDWRPALTALATTAVMTISACALWPTSARTFIHTIFLGGQEYGKLSSFVNADQVLSIIAFFMRPPFHYGLLSEAENLALCVGVMVLALFAAHRLWNPAATASARS